MALALPLVAFACAGDGTEIVDSTLGGPGLEPTLASIQEHIFTPICSDCHVPGGQGPMPLDSASASYQSLVSQPSVEVALLRVTPGDPANSYLILKLQGAPGIVGERMPLGKAPLTPEQIQAIVDWIASGAAP